MIYTIRAVAHLLDRTEDQIRALLRSVVEPLERHFYYLYSVPRRDSAVSEGPAAPRMERTLVVFQTPDDALAFLQQAGIPGVPQVRPFRREAVVLRLLGDPSIREIIFFEHLPEWLPSPLRREDLSLLPGTYALDRTTLLTQIPLDEASPNG